MTQQPTEFRLNKAKLPTISDRSFTARGTEVRRITVSGRRSVTEIYFQKVEDRWVPFKRLRVSVN